MESDKGGIMATKIPWCDVTWNPITGCSPISEGCANCYAKRMAETRLRGRMGYDRDEPFKITYHRDKLFEVERWEKPRKIFVCSMGDLFHEEVTGNFINSVWMMMFNHPRHTFMVLTKRPDRLLKWTQTKHGYSHWPIEDIWPDHIWLGVTAENQKRWNERVPILCQIPAAKRFVSVEPMLEEIDTVGLSGLRVNFVDWVICGPETGPGKRPFNFEWAEKLYKHCNYWGVPFFWKPDDGRLPREWPE